MLHPGVHGPVQYACLRARLLLHNPRAHHHDAHGQAQRVCPPRAINTSHSPPVLRQDAHGLVTSVEMPAVVCINPGWFVLCQDVHGLVLRVYLHAPRLQLNLLALLLDANGLVTSAQMAGVAHTHRFLHAPRDHAHGLLQDVSLHAAHSLHPVLAQIQGVCGWAQHASQRATRIRVWKETIARHHDAPGTAQHAIPRAVLARLKRPALRHTANGLEQHA